nr:MAG TPA: cytidylate kinase [Caudoviricetes sp.]
MNRRIIIVAGRSGSGKSTLSRSLAVALGRETLGFSYAGRELAKAEKQSKEFLNTEEYLYHCISSALLREELLIIDGLASQSIFDRLVAEGFGVAVIYLDTPDRVRIKRIAKRENCSIETARMIEKAKAAGKAKSGLDYVIRRADTAIDGRQCAAAILKQALTYCRAVIDADNWAMNAE